MLFRSSSRSSSAPAPSATKAVCAPPSLHMEQQDHHPEDARAAQPSFSPAYTMQPDPPPFSSTLAAKHVLHPLDAAPCSLPSSTTKSRPHLHQYLTERKEKNLGPPETCRRSPARNPSHGAGWGCKRAVEAGSRESGRRRGRRRPRGARGRAARHRSSPEAGGVGAGGGEDFLGREGEEAPVLCVWSERGLKDRKSVV